MAGTTIIFPTVNSYEFGDAMQIQRQIKLYSQTILFICIIRYLLFIEYQSFFFVQALE
jgi:hypothetical protein